MLIQEQLKIDSVTLGTSRTHSMLSKIIGFWLLGISTSSTSLRIDITSRRWTWQSMQDDSREVNAWDSNLRDQLGFHEYDQDSFTHLGPITLSRLDRVYHNGQPTDTQGWTSTCSLLSNAKLSAHRPMSFTFARPEFRSDRPPPPLLGINHPFFSNGSEGQNAAL